MQALIITITFVITMFFLAIFSTFLGGVLGWIVSGVFPYVIDTLNKLAGLNLTGFEMGATLGFFGSFFKASNTNKREK